MPPLVSDKEEVTSRGLEEEIYPRMEEGDFGGFCSPYDQGSVVKLPQPSVIIQQEPVEIPSEYWKVFMETTTSSIEFQIRDIKGEAPMKHIPLTTFPKFHGISMEDRDILLF